MRMVSVLCVAAVAFRLAAIAFVASDEVTMEKLHVDSFTVAGIEARTSNAREMSADGVIGKLWARLRHDHILRQISNRVDSNVIALYTDYESDKDGAYTYLLGAKVSSAKDIPAGMVSRKVDGGTYAMFTEQDGPPAQVTVDLWKRIWSLEKTSQLHRAYKTDFEVHYGGSANDPTNAHVEIYVGTKSAQ